MSPLFQSSMYNVLSPWTRWLMMWTRIGVELMWRDGYLTINLHDELMFVRCSMR